MIHWNGVIVSCIVVWIDVVFYLMLMVLSTLLKQCWVSHVLLFSVDTVLTESLHFYQDSFSSM